MTQQVFLNSPYLVPSAVDWAVAPFTTQKRAPAMANNVNIQEFLHIFDGIHPNRKILIFEKFIDAVTE